MHIFKNIRIKGAVLKTAPLIYRNTVKSVLWFV